MDQDKLSDRAAFALRPAAVFAVWCAWCVVALALLAVPGLYRLSPDDWMRLFEVRDLLAGQGWFDVTQYRVDPPAGASMHWSRLVDLPLAAVAAIAGERAALTIVPLLYLLPTLLALRAIMLRLGFGPLALAIGLAVAVLFPLLPGAFAPYAIDHHAPQAVLGIWVAALLLSPSRKAAALAGVLGAAWIAISLEGLPMVAGFAGVLGLAYWLDADRRLGAFLGALALAVPLISLATRPVSDFALPYCDIVMPGHMLAFGAAAAIALALPFAPMQATATGRLAGLALIAAVAAPVGFVALGPCASDPFAQLDPLLKTYWHGYITEGLPIWRQPLSVAAVQVWTLLLVAVGWHLMRGSAARTRPLDTSALIAAIAALYSFLLMREAILAQLLAVPFAAALLAHYLPRARALGSALPRIAATLACFGLLTPILASAALKPLDPVFAGAAMRDGAMAPIDPRPCDIARLAALPRGKVLASFDIGPEILGLTDHTIVAASYHRNQARMRDVIAAFTGSPADAEAILRTNHVDYVVACAAKADLALYRAAMPGNFANVLASGDVPAWLEPVAGFETGSLRAYRLR